MESLVHLAVVLTGRYFIERAAQCACQQWALLGVDPPQVQQVSFIGQKNYRRHIGTANTNNQLVQLINQVKAVAVCHRVHQHHCVSPLDGAGHMVR